LGALLSSPTWPAEPRVAHAWVGEALAIKDPTAAVFRPQSGSNVLLVGQADESALAVLGAALVGLAAQLPHPVRVGGWRELPELINELAKEVERRQAAREATPPFLYLFVYSLQRFRELRPVEDDYGFGRGGEDKPPNPAEQFTAILRDGPAVGVFT